ncbi:hypothetical protein FRC02_001760 [Tulasnella sp. 418]|nr:hypothetical protein FRC02_001760 [Tulasnella sp. 418]
MENAEQSAQGGVETHLSLPPSNIEEHVDSPGQPVAHNSTDNSNQGQKSKKDEDKLEKKDEEQKNKDVGHNSTDNSKQGEKSKQDKEKAEKKDKEEQKKKDDEEVKKKGEEKEEESAQDKKEEDLEKLEKTKEPEELERRNVDDDTVFWQTYVSESGKFDKEMIDNWNDNLDSLLLFAALFSAINTAFIIEAYKRLQPDALETTNSLLKLMLRNRTNDETMDLKDQQWSPPTDAVRINSTLFASLACSLLASFGAILGKEMLAEYKSSGALNTLPEQGRRRQRKFNGLNRYRFQLLMQALPIMLQLSLALFLLGIIDFLLQMSPAVAAVIIVPVFVGFVAYIVSVIVAIQQEDSPFQTSLSKSLRSLLPMLKHFLLKSLPTFARRLRDYLIPLPGKVWNGINQRTASIHKYIKQHGTELLSKVDPFIQPLRRTQLYQMGSRVVEKMFIVLHIGGIGMLGCLVNGWDRFHVRIEMPRWYKNGWDQLGTRISITLHICGLGIMGWFVMGWEALTSTLGIFQGQEEEVISDVVSGDCAAWLLENSHDVDVLRKTLETIPLLPADILLQRFKMQPKILERYVLMYKATLQRRPGDVDYQIDAATARDSITCGTALFHVLKLRKTDEWTSDQGGPLTIGGDPELSGALWNLDQYSKLGLPLLTVFHCMQIQSGEPISSLGYYILDKLLDYFLDTLKNRSSAIESANASSSLIFQLAHTPTTSPITLMLDSGIFLVSHGYPRRDSFWLESILGTIHHILEAHAISMSLTSHVALLIAVIQWHRKKTKQVDEQRATDEGIGFNGVTQVDLRKAWLAVDKRSVPTFYCICCSLTPSDRAEFFDNVILAFNLVGKKDSSGTIRIYLDLLIFTEHFLPKVMDVSGRNHDWPAWFAKVFQIIPGLLRLLRQVSLKSHPDACHTAIRIISRFLPDDWSHQDVVKFLSKPENAKLHIISPLHAEYGPIMTALVSFCLSSDTTALSSPRTRRSVAEVLGWMIACPGVEGRLPSLINNSTGIYQQSTTVPTFLLSIMTDARPSRNLAAFCEYHLSLLLKISPQHLSSSRVQFEVLAIMLAQDRRAYTHFEDITALIDEMTQGEEDISWPKSFLEHNLAQWAECGDGASRRKVLKLVKPSRPHRMLFRQGPNLNDLWRGEGLMILWRKLSSHDTTDTSYHSYMFREGITLTVLNCFDRAVSENCQVSCQPMSSYLEKALQVEWVETTLKQRIEDSLVRIRLGMTEGWDSLMLKSIAEKGGGGHMAKRYTSLDFNFETM